MASRIGTGNLAGVATAVSIGGPGAVFWMWLERGKDSRSPHYICPDNLEAEHDRISEKIRAKKEKERTEEEIRKALKNEDKFKEMKSRFFGLMFTDGNIVVRMLETS